MPVTPSPKTARLLLMGSAVFLVGVLSFTLHKETPAQPLDMGANAVQQREAAIAAAKARGEHAYSFETRFMPGGVHE